ncbi:MAG: iron-containing alcohol dehydrogenase [Leptospiraceae bacterium]|nr:iron-containing alcohol dehydrogenase [Leptospiraceae bacterium]
MRIESIQNENQSQKIVSGSNCLCYLAEEINKSYPLFQTNILIITSKSQQPIVDNLIKHQFEIYQCGLQILVSEGEPSCVELDRFRDSILKIPKLVIGIGGGSVIDYAKAIAGLVLHKEPSNQFLEGVGTIKYRGPSLPVVAIPTTAGTGSECTINTVLTFTDSKNITWKKSIRHLSLLPKIVFLDPNLTIELPINKTLYSALDAFSQSMEAYLSKESNPITDNLALESLKQILIHLPIVIKNPYDINSRLNLLSASSKSGIALTSAGLGVVHGLAGVLGAVTSLPHGHICAALLYPTFELYGEECNAEEISILNKKLKVLLPENTNEDQNTAYKSFHKYLGDWLKSLIPIPPLSHPNSEFIILKVLDQFSIRNHPTPFSKHLAKISLMKAFGYKF